MKNKFIVLSIIFLVYLPFIYALGDMDMIVNVQSSATISYEGGQTSASGSVKNTNWFCDIECSYSTNQGDSGNIPLISAGETGSFSYNVHAQGSSPKSVSVTVSCSAPGSGTGCFTTPSSGSDIKYTNVVFGYCGDGTKQSQENCASCYSDSPCNPGYHCEGTSCIRDSYCGDGIKDSGENCANCQQDVSCSSNQACSSGGQCITLGTSQNCGSIGNSCTSNEECVSRTCRTKCGNGRKDSGENCANCPQDAGCSSNQDCSTSGQCIQLGTSQNCASIGNSCGTGFCANGKCVECKTTSDCASKKGKESTGKYECSGDKRGRYEIMVEKGGQCISGKCSGSNEIKSTHLESCGNNVCYNGQCSCPEGYGKCEKTWTCEKRGTILEGKTCDCDVQCESGTCDSGKCVNVLEVTLSSSEAKLKPGEETTVTFSISNNLNKKVDFTATLGIGSGATINNVISGETCVENQCTITGTLTERGNRDVTVTITSQSEVTVPLTSTVAYSVDGKNSELSRQTSVDYTTSSKKKPGSSASTPVTNLDFSKIPQNYLVIGVVAIVILILVISYFVGKSHKPKKKEKEVKESKKEEKEESKISNSAAKEIEELHELMKKGILTKGEFEKKKKQLLKKG